MYAARGNLLWRREESLVEFTAIGNNAAQKSLGYRTFVIGIAMRHNCYFIWNNVYWLAALIRADSVRLNTHLKSFLSTECPLFNRDIISWKLSVERDHLDSRANYFFPPSMNRKIERSVSKYFSEEVLNISGGLANRGDSADFASNANVFYG